ncbi:MAG: hypothetical protein EKK45_01875 [Curvibacter sp.]|nr:MAG: hypothetical protein EKK45_01875 [Curvibacter sp.]
MKKVLATLALSASSLAMAAGVYDGIYSNQNIANEYLSVHTSGSRMIVTEYTAATSNGTVYFSSPIGTVRPPAVPVWQLFSGTLVGSTVSLTGQYPFNACDVGLTVNFTTTGLTLSFTGAVNNTIGNSTGVSCSSLPSLVGTQSYLKIF